MNIDKNKVRLARARACMSAQDIADASGFTVGFVMKMCAGCNAKPENIGKIARALGVDVLDIIEQEAETNG